ncbi:MAG: glycosyltransferase family 9 protein [Deltaproteobacteria bacterium]|nr:glycosyltransferase family 9 protein [Deltaproteobacteria bacterium]MBW2050802.1 glycosyltransferase family 9 protein [Deltaproteobacteria bacterium]MBW2140906.1 glycosyltransferase family 9 protein [Deltaproteobacteria bacterium]MBW2322669.1 glycosyltransferase family 9 protein [Deltaproteobacteria bacterium]
MTIPEASPATVLVIQLARFGDVLQTTPLLSALKARYPNCQLSVLITPNQTELAKTNPNIDKILTVDLEYLSSIARSASPLSEKIKRLSKSTGQLKNQEYDRLINLNTSRIAALLGHFIPAKKREGARFGQDRKRLLTAPWTGFIMNLMANRRLIRFNLVDLLTTYAGNGVQPPERLTYPLTSEMNRMAAGLLGPHRNGPLIGFQLGSRHEARQWPIEYFTALGQRLIKENEAQIVLLGTDQERSLGEKFLAELFQTVPQSRGKVINLMGKTTIPGLAGVLNRLDLLVTTDTGSMHLAAAVGTQILALFMGPAYCHETGPYGPGHLIIQSVTDCSPCTENESQCTDTICRYQIKPDFVFLLSSYLLKKKTKNIRFQRELESNLRVLVSEIDDFGAIYRPLVTRPLDLEEVMAHAWREAGRSFMRAKYRLNHEKLAAEFMRFEPAKLPGLGDLVRGLIALDRLLPFKKGQHTMAAIQKIVTGEPTLEPLVRTFLDPEMNSEKARLMMDNIKTVVSIARSFCASSESNTEADVCHEAKG